ncbi:hypothetical protein F5H01DRAFT_279335, partial [Linnemannia elongata]
PLPIRNLIKTLKECPEAELAAHIEANPEWTWPRGDLFHWVGVLNRFDEILDTLCKTHDMKKPQPKELSPADRRLTLAILSFSRLLLESCTNRNLYASYEQLNDLLNTRDLDILESCLRLLLRPAQRHSAQRSARSIFTVSQDRLLALAHSWGSKEYGLDLQQLADDKAEIPERLRSVNFQFFRTVAPSKNPITDSPPTSSAAPTGHTIAASSATTPSSASAPPTSASGKPRRHSNSGTSSSHVSAVILNHLVQEYQVPEEHHFQLLSRIRIATGIRDPKRRQQLLLIRILAVAVMSHVLSEAVIVEKFFAFEPEIIQSLTDLIHPDHKVPFPVQTVALFALDGLAHLRNRQPDVLTAINASASHGVLLYALRKIITGLDSENAPYPQDFLDAMFALISYIISSQTGGNMVISAGLVPVLLQLLSNKHSSHLKNVTKSVTILDSLVYGFSTAFTSFCTSGGLNSLVARMKEEVDYSLKLVKDAEASQMTDVSSTDAGAPKGSLSYISHRLTALSKAMFKFIIHMMQSPGTHEGLRNLIETTLPATLRDIMEHPSALGNSIYAHAINTMTSFIHNEPTSLSILQEAKIPQTLLASLSKDIPASNDVVMNLPGAFGAICLNASGLEMFTKDFDIKKFFDVFTSVPHVRAFQDSDIASTLGVSMDELVRHQPTLKSKVMTELGETLKTVLKMCESDAVTEDDISLCTLQKSRAKDAPPLGEVVDDDASKDDRKDSLVAQLIESSARFCESFFQNAASAHEFLKADGIDTLLRFYSLPTLPYDLANSSAFFTLSHLLKLLSEANPAAAISAVVKEVNRILQQVQPLLDSTNPGSDLVQYIDIADSSDEDVSRGNNMLRSLISLHAFSGLLSDMYCAPTFSHGRNSAAVLAAFVSAHGDQALAGLGQLHRACLWESIAMKRFLGKNWNDPSSKTKRTHIHVPMPGTVDEHVEEPAGEDKDMAAATPSVDMYSPTVINTKFLRFVLTQIPQYITPMYQGITKMLFSRRDMEPAQRTNAFKIADSLSGVLQSHINWKRLGRHPDKYTYLGTMFNLLPYLLLDDRNPTTLQTIMTASFVRTGGLETLFTWLDSAWAEASTIRSASVASEGEQKVLLARVHGCVETLLNVLQTLTSSKLLLESSHTMPLTSKDDKNRKEDFFNPHEFLVDVRLMVVPRIQQLWLDKHLDQCPALLVRHIIQIFINVLKASGELKPPVVAPPPPSSGTGAGTGAGSSASNVFGVRPVVPDANSVAMLLDMGFPRSAAELALTRSGNQLERATEYLLTHQEVVAAAIYEQEREEAAARAAAIAAANEPPVPPTPASSADTVVTATTGATDASTTEQAPSEAAATGDSSDATDAATTQSTAEEATQEGAIDVEDDQPTEEEKREQEYKLALDLHQEHKDQLSKAREELKLVLVSRSLELIESIDNIVFYVRDLLVLLCKDKDSTVLEEVVKDLEKASTNLGDASRGCAFGARLRLLALLFGDVTIQSKMSDHTTILVPLLFSILEEHVQSQAPQKGNPWLSPLLLMVESFVSLSDEPKVVPDEATPDGKSKAADKEMKEDIVSPVDMENLLQHSITLLKQEDLTKDIALSVFRILVRLTRHHSLAMSFLKAQGLELIFSTLKPERIGVQGQQSFIVMILRHIIEDTVVLQEVMEKEIVRWFTQPSRARTGDLQSYLRHNNFLGLRDLDAFIAGTALQLTLSKPAVPSKPDSNKDQGDSAKDEETGKDKEHEKESDSNAGEGSSSQPPAEPQSSATSEISETVIHFLVSELLGARDSVPAPSSPTSALGDSVKHGEASSAKATSASDKNATPAAAAQHDANFIHRCFVLQCLNELLISYPSCKVDLMNYSRRKGGKESYHAATKPRSNWLNFLLNDLIPYRGTVVQSSETELRKHSIESNFASAVLVAMCSNGDEEEEKKPFSELVQVRRFVIDGLIRSFKDAIASTLPVEFKYGKFLSLSELSYKILGSSPPAGAMAKPSEDMSINIVKVMLEKNFILTLTNVLADIDLNYPHAKILVNAVLKPLEHLTKLSLKMSRATDPGAARARRQSTSLSGTGSGAGSGDDAPDLYRNSSLGMFDGATMESAEDDDSDDEGDEDDIFEGEEYDEETASDASDLSEDELSDDDDDEDELEEMEDLDDEDMEGDDDDEDLDEEMEAELQEALDDEDDDDEEMMEWDANSRPIILQDDEIGEVIDDEDDDPQDGEDDEDEDEDDLDDLDEDEEGDEEDDEEDDDIVLLDDSGLLNGAQVVDLRGRRPRASGRRLEDRGFVAYDSAADQGRFSYIEDDEFPLLGAPARNPFLQVSDDVITHPLLAQPRPASSSVTADAHRRAAPRSGLGLSGGISDWHAFEDLLNGNPSQILGTLMNGGAIRASHGAFRVEVNSGHGHAIIAPIDRSGSRSAAPADAASVAAVGSSSDAALANKPDMFGIVQNFVPFSTSQRWSQECRMMYGATAQDKATRLLNHVTNALIPAAKEEHRLKQERDAKEQEIRRKAEAEKKRIAEEKKKAEEEAERIRAEEAERVRIAEEAAAAEREAVRLAELAAARAARGETEEEPATEGTMEVEEVVGVTAEPAEEPEPATPARRTVMIDGVMVDITDSDIDPEFLEALPEDMRREVYNDYLQSRRPPAPTTTQPPATSTSTASQSINPDFLDALPQNMRAELDEILRGQGAVPDDPASGLPMMTAFTDTLSRLVPQLRQIYQDGGNNPAALAEASAILDRMPRNYPGLREVRDMIASTGSGSSAKKAVVPRDAIQLVDKSSLATLVRLMFLPQPPSKNILNKLLVNLCENSKTRIELMSLLLSILQDGGADLAAVDKSFAQMSLRGKPIVKAHNHKGKGVGTLPAPMPSAMDNVPNLVARRCFDALYYIVSLNSQAAQFFLTEHENVTLKRSPSKKGKGKDKDKTISSKYPIVLLLGLLERPTFVENSALMEQLMMLLSILCRPLATLVKDGEEKDKKTDDKDKREAEAPPAEPSASSTSAELAAGSSATPPTTTTEEGSTSALSTIPADATVTTTTDTKADAKADTKVAETDPQALKPPVIPDHCIQLVIRVLTAGECSSRTFQYTLSVIQNLSALEGARDVITAELVRAARELGAGILTDLGTLSETLTNAMTGVDVQGVVLEQFTPASSKQAKLLRVLKTIDYMYSRKQGLTPAPTSTQEKATQIYDSLAFQALWTKVGDTLELIHERSDMVHVATVLLPLVESFMVVCKYVGLRPSTLEMEEDVCKATTNSTEELFLQFTEKHSKILNIMVRNNPALMSGSFSLLVHNPKMLEFDNKRNYFTQQVHKRTANQGHYGTLQMNVRREMVFIDSFTQLQSRSGEEIKYSKLNVHFHGEEGVDAGGVTREWFQVLARQMFNPDYAMFKTSAADKLTYQPNRASWVNPDHLLFFKFIGRVIGKAIYDGRLLDAYFTRSFYKHILGRPVDYRDVEAVDPEYYKSLVWMLENDITDIVEETFSVETDDFGTMKTVDLKPNGRNIPVTEENKHEYVKYITEQKLTLAIKDQIHSFLQGFHEIIPAHLISIFNEQELELLISGLPDIDVDEWKNNAEYQNYSQASPQIQYFWRAVRSFDQTERAKLLQFVTGTSKVPLGGFSQLQGISGVQKFQIHKDFSSTKRLPSAHTCFNQLDLPEYETYDELRQQLLTAISECSTGFAFA